MVTGEETVMSEQNNEELKQKIREYLKKTGKSKNRDVAKALNEDKRHVDKAIGELANDGEIEYLYLNGSYIQLKEK